MVHKTDPRLLHWSQVYTGVHNSLKLYNKIEPVRYSQEHNNTPKYDASARHPMLSYPLLYREHIHSLDSSKFKVLKNGVFNFLFANPLCGLLCCNFSFAQCIKTL